MTDVNSQAEIDRLRRENEQLRADLAESRRGQAWIESRVADLDFEVQSLRTRLQESQEMRRELERRIRS